MFFAALPDEDTRSRLIDAARAVQVAAPARLVTPSNYHLTLAFVGDVEPARVALLREVGGAAQVEEFSLAITAYEHWPDSQVLVLTAPVLPASLQDLWRTLHTGFLTGAEMRAQAPLRAHVTLARKVVQAPVLPAMSAFDWKVRAFSLMRSDRVGHRQVYTVVATWPLLDESASAR
jgi:2'-5' RNA ligase